MVLERMRRLTPRRGNRRDAISRTRGRRATKAQTRDLHRVVVKGALRNVAIIIHTVSRLPRRWVNWRGAIWRRTWVGRRN